MDLLLNWKNEGLIKYVPMHAEENKCSKDLEDNYDDHDDLEDMIDSREAAESSED